jgi:FAD/FMN-containing dehydrogenase
MKTTKNDLKNYDQPIEVHLNEKLAEFKSAVRGQVILPDDQDYETSRRIWNGIIDKRPLAIIKCTGNADVIKTVNFARNNNLNVSVRGGGHNVAGNAICDGGIVIDLSLINNVVVDYDNKKVRVGGGATLGDVDHETQMFGMATPIGLVSKTGIAGLTLHGGMGLLSRKFGLTSDNLIAAEVVTANGQLLKTDEHRHADLFWALRGGGGSFGIVTSFEFRIHPVGPDILLALVMYPFDQAISCLRKWRDFMIDAPDEIMSIAILWSFPEEDFIPEAYRLKPNLTIAATHTGTPEIGEKALQPLMNLGTPVANLSGPTPFLSAQRLFDPEYPDGRRYYWKSTYVNALDEELIETLTSHALKRPSVLTSLDVWRLGGALSRVKKDATAFAQREAPFMVALESNWKNPADDDTNISWSRMVHDDLQKFSTGGTYLNFPGFGENGGEMVRKTFGSNFEKLRAVKEKYDPENFFSSTIKIR